MQPIPPPPSLDEFVSQASDLTGTPLLIAIYVCAFVIVALRDWRLVIAAFMGLYLGLALLAATISPPEWALIRVITGGLVAIIWYLSAQRAGWGGRFLPFQSESHTGVHARPLSSTTLFRVLLALLLAVALLAARPRLPLPPLPPDFRLAATWLAAFALLGLALGDEALQAGAALLMMLAATHLVMGALQQDAWLLWLMSTVELLLALAIGYLMVARGPTLASHDEAGG